MGKPQPPKPRQAKEAIRKRNLNALLPECKDLPQFSNVPRNERWFKCGTDKQGRDVYMWILREGSDHESNIRFQRLNDGQDAGEEAMFDVAADEITFFPMLRREVWEPKHRRYCKVSASPQRCEQVWTMHPFDVRHLTTSTHPKPSDPADAPAQSLIGKKADAGTLDDGSALGNPWKCKAQSPAEGLEAIKRSCGESDVRIREWLDGLEDARADAGDNVGTKTAINAHWLNGDGVAIYQHSDLRRAQMAPLPLLFFEPSYRLEQEKRQGDEYKEDVLREENAMLKLAVGGLQKEVMALREYDVFPKDTGLEDDDAEFLEKPSMEAGGADVAHEDRTEVVLARPFKRRRTDLGSSRAQGGDAEEDSLYTGAGRDDALNDVTPSLNGVPAVDDDEHG